MIKTTLPESPLIVILDEGYGGTDVEAAVLAPFGARVVEIPCNGSADAVRKAVAGADAVLVRESPVDAAAIDAMPTCRAIVRYGVGVDNIDRPHAASRGIYVANVPDYGVEEVSDQALALLFAVARRIVSRDRAVRQGAWNVARTEPMYRLRGGTLGLIGYGRIASAFHRKARSIGYDRCLIFDPYLREAPEGAELADLDRLAAEADVVSLHAPLTAETKHIVDAGFIVRMKPTAIVVNTSRGGLIDSAALAAALQESRIFGAGLDVFEQEPPAADNPFFGLSNAVVSDHTGWYSEQSVDDLRRKASEEIARVFSGETPRNWVNRWEGGEARPKTVDCKQECLI
ncbi:C-terminal binding protein [Rhizobium sp. P32RR-XVIII]|uniref:C-terminal binding protein n=1 Tax=Rhizobium sp. P32RR-XVIII TaxID=2726738 RepID=UPI0014566073|nr:C-terminal binding protein [Rhizobium sp. P32RR-XVIII]NLS08049.1 C-terminal binding protein [Rhizobium sp. P32RR-XVIII]